MSVVNIILYITEDYRILHPETFAKIDLAGPLIVQNRIAAARNDDLPQVNDVGPACYLQSVTNIVVGEQNADAGSRELFDNLLYLVNRDRVDAGKRLIQ